MEQIVCKNLSFAYPLSDKNALNGISFGVGRGEFVVICGRSGCGKTTLLRHLKKNLLPSGKRAAPFFLKVHPLTNSASEPPPKKSALSCRIPKVRL